MYTGKIKNNNYQRSQNVVTYQFSLCVVDKVLKYRGLLNKEEKKTNKQTRQSTSLQL